MNTPTSPAASTPYRLTIWSGAEFHTIGRFATFGAAIVAYAGCDLSSKALLNDARRDEETSGLTDEESDAVFSLPATRRATDAEFMRNVSPLLGSL